MIRRTNERTISGLIYRRLLSLTPACCLYFKAYIMPRVGDIPCLITTDKHRETWSQAWCLVIMQLFPLLTHFRDLFHLLFSCFTRLTSNCIVYCRLIYIYTCVIDFQVFEFIFYFPSLSFHLRLDNMISYIVYIIKIIVFFMSDSDIAQLAAQLALRNSQLKFPHPIRF